LNNAPQHRAGYSALERAQQQDLPTEGTRTVAQDVGGAGGAWIAVLIPGSAVATE
jgi:hypothetical protein